jgi:O-antigen ligase
MIRLYASVLDGPRDTRLLGVGWRNWRAALDAEASINDDIRLGIVSLPRSLKNMYLTLLVEQGLVGLLFMLLIFVTILQSLYRGSRAVTDPPVQLLLWAIFSGALGFLTNMLFFDSFYFVAVQISFWSLVGFGMAIALEFGPSSRGWYRVHEFHH